MNKQPSPDSAIEQSTRQIEHKIAHQSSPVRGGVATGALAGAVVGAFAGPPGVLVAAAVGAAIGAAAGATLKLTDAQSAVREHELDRALGVEGGEIGAPNLQHPSSTLGSFHAPPTVAMNDAQMDKWVAAGVPPVSGAAPVASPPLVTTTRVRVELSVEDMKLLRDHLARHVEHVEAEVAGTDKRELRHALALELEALRSIQLRLRTAAIVEG